MQDRAVLSAADVMTRDVVGLSGNCSVFEAAQTLVDRCLSGAPVVDDTGKLIGVVTEEDVVALLYEDDSEDLTSSLVGASVLGSPLVTRRVVSVRPDTPLPDIMRLLMLKRIKRVPVLADDGEVVGIVSRRDILRSKLAQVEAGG